MEKIDNRIDNQTIGDKAVQKSLFEIIKKKNRKVTKAILIHETGLSMYKIEDSLNVLLYKYPCHLTVSEEGELIYNFDLSKSSHPQASFFTQAISLIGQVLSFGFKLWIAIMLYTFGLGLGIVITLILLVALQTPAPIFYFLIGIFLSIKELVESIYYYIMPSQRPKDYKKSDNNILEIAFETVFGPKWITDELLIEKKVLDYLARHEYQITVAELALLTSWSLEKADKEMVQLMINYGAEPKVTANGIIIYHFDEIKKNTTTQKQAKIVVSDWVHDYKPLQWASTQTTKEVGILMNLAVAFGAILISGASYFLAPIDAGYFPFVVFAFTLLFFIIPLCLKSKMYTANIARAKLNYRRACYQYIFANLPEIKQSDFPTKQLPIIDAIRFGLEGEHATDTEGNIIHEYKRLAEEINEIEQSRNQKIVFDSKINIKAQKIDTKPKVQKLKVIFLAILLVVVGGGVMGFNYFNFFKKAQVTSLRLSGEDKFEYLPIYTELEEIHFSTTYGWNTLPKELLKLKKLKKITLESYSQNQDYSLLAQLPQLKELVIINNRQNQDYLGEIMEISSLESLSIFVHKLDTLPASISKLQNLKELHISSIKLKAFPKAFFELKNLQKLTLSSTKIFEDYSLLAQLPQLKELVIRDNIPIENKMEQLMELHNLESLSIVNSYLDSLPASISKLQNLQELNLSSNEIITFPKALLELKKLKKINLSSNPKFEGYDLLAQLPQLEELDVSYNKLKERNLEELMEIKGITSLSMRNCELRTLPSNISNLSNLKYLNIEHNSWMTDFPPVIMELSSLEILHTGFEKKDIPKDWSALHNIKEIYISYNRYPYTSDIDTEDIILPKGASIYIGDKESVLRMKAAKKREKAFFDKYIPTFLRRNFIDVK